MSKVHVYRLNSQAITSEEFGKRFDQVWSEIQCKSELASLLTSVGIDPTLLQGKQRSDFFQVEKRSDAGFTGLETVVVNFLVGISVKLFEIVILPRIVKGLNRNDVKLESQIQDRDSGLPGTVVPHQS